MDIGNIAHYMEDGLGMSIREAIPRKHQLWGTTRVAKSIIRYRCRQSASGREAQPSLSLFLSCFFPNFGLSVARDFSETRVSLLHLEILLDVLSRCIIHAVWLWNDEKFTHEIVNSLLILKNFLKIYPPKIYLAGITEESKRKSKGTLRHLHQLYRCWIIINIGRTRMPLAIDWSRLVFLYHP